MSDELDEAVRSGEQTLVDQIRENLARRPWWMNGMFGFCLFMAVFYMPWDIFVKPMAISVQQFLSTLHCLLPVNGGARENWPRAGLEAMAVGVPIVAQNDWGWREMIEHGVTGFLGSNDCELAHYAACLAYGVQDIIQHCLRERLALCFTERRRQPGFCVCKPFNRNDHPHRSEFPNKPKCSVRQIDAVVQRGH